MIQEHSDSSSEIYTDLKVWFKNFDVFKKKSMFDFDAYETHYSFNNCDLVLNDRNIVIIGKMKILGKEKTLTPTVFEFVNNSTDYKPGHVRIENIDEVDKDLEIEFSDVRFKNRMTLVIKKARIDLKEKIKIRSTTL